MEDKIVLMTKLEFISILRDELKAALSAKHINEISTKQFITRSEACEIIGISLPTLDALIKNGKLKKYTGAGKSKILLKLSDVQEYIKPK